MTLLGKGIRTSDTSYLGKTCQGKGAINERRDHLESVSQFIEILPGEAPQ